jgi:hypothetical protein
LSFGGYCPTLKVTENSEIKEMANRLNVVPDKKRDPDKCFGMAG